jgi:hypothetical protein
VSDGARRPSRGLVGAGALAALVVYGAFVHHGIGPSRGRAGLEWWQPRGFLLGGVPDGIIDDVRIALAVFLVPALVLAALVWRGTRSALARTVAVWMVLGAALCVYYGLEAAGIWRFFHWRGSAVMWLFALAVAVALVSPWLAERFERLAWPARLALYLPAALLVLACMRNATGTDQSLQFAISPWPVVPFFGLELVVPVVCFALACVALARTSLGAGAGPVARGVVSGVACAVAILLVVAAVARGVSLDWKVSALASCLAAAVLARGRISERGGGGAPPGRRAALGALGVAAPVLAGLLWVEDDYRVTRDERAARINEGLQAYLAREGQYPDRLDDLVEAGLLRKVPEPRVGFAFLDRPQFVYQNFGINYLLEFSAPRWVQCAYNPPYFDEEDGEEEEFEDEEIPSEEDEDGLPGSWSCPSKPPELW